MLRNVGELLRASWRGETTSANNNRLHLWLYRVRKYPHENPQERKDTPIVVLSFISRVSLGLGTFE